MPGPTEPCASVGIWCAWGMTSQGRGTAAREIGDRLALCRCEGVRRRIRRTVTTKDVTQTTAFSRCVCRHRVLVHDCRHAGYSELEVSVGWGIRKRSSGLQTRSRCWRVTCRYRAVVARLVCPSKRCRMGRSTPAPLSAWRRSVADSESPDHW
jgi:hypothetical protein